MEASLGCAGDCPPGIVGPHLWGVPIATHGKRFSESFPEPIAHDGVDEGVDTAAGVGESVGEDLEDVERRARGEPAQQDEAQVEQVDGEPRNGEQDNHSGHHLGDFLAPVGKSCPSSHGRALRHFRFLDRKIRYTRLVKSFL